MNTLSDNALDLIYCFKHEMEFKQCVNDINKYYTGRQLVDCYFSTNYRRAKDMYCDIEDLLCMVYNEQFKFKKYTLFNVCEYLTETKKGAYGLIIDILEQEIKINYDDDIMCLNCGSSWNNESYITSPCLC